ncbi:peptidase C39 family protein [Nocardioides yefusunii]|uniref:Peptidase C39 family protein n=1 Tax=Nocardioides yefusunii TaxID=2500546 RepID=A0ABW1QVX5_9ACTN|nr:peptidase C39 family protein [Nocardioides yefusunii]
MFPTTRRRNAAPATRRATAPLVTALTTTLATALVSATTVGMLGLAPSAHAAKAKAKSRTLPTATVLTTKSFDSTAQLAKGTTSGTTVANGSVKLKSPKKIRTIAGNRYRTGTWTSPWVNTKTFTELLPSWQATTPGHSLVQIQVRVKKADGTTGSWDTLARWTSQNDGVLNGSQAYARKSWTRQSDDLASIATDTVVVNDRAAGATGWQVRVELMRRAGTTDRPVLHRVGASASEVIARRTTSKPGKVARAGIVLDVPRLSQMTHAGHYPQYGNGGEAWCSATSVAMVLEYYGANPAEAHAYSPVLNGRAHTDGVVDFTARAVYDHAYRGTGNWGFNTAYAGTLLRKTRVHRLPHLKSAEKYLAAGTPLIVSVAFGKGQLSGAPISATPGHLMVLIGFTPDGDVIVNDPAAKTNDQVRRRYDRAQFEKAWLSRSGGLTYVMED